MKRRSFLKTAAAAFPVSGLSAFALGQAAPTTDGVHPVGAGEDRLGETHSLGFSTILFKVLPRETSGRLFVIEHKGLGARQPSRHFLSIGKSGLRDGGQVLFQVGDSRKTLRAGESCIGPRGSSAWLPGWERRRRIC